MSDAAVIRDRLKERVASAFVRRDEREIFDPYGNESKWFFDFKKILLNPGNLKDFSELIWSHLKDRSSFQLGGLETAAIALISGVVMRAEADGVSLNGFYIRKSRKRDGMQRHIEGVLTDEAIVLLDDGMNSGQSIMRQIAALEAEGKKIAEVCVLLLFRDESYYQELKKRGVRIWSLFTLDDFPESGGLLQVRSSHPELLAPFHVNWKFESEDPHYELVLPKSAPIADDERVYFGADNGSMWALNQNNGSIAWNYKTLRSGRKRIFSSPALSRGTIFFGAYDGNFYALDAVTGKKKWIFFEADWIGSSPCVAEDIDTVFVGLEFGLWRKEGGLTALDTATGEKRWFQQIESLVHSSPAYSKKYNTVVVGSQSSGVHAFDAQNGRIRWRYADAPDVRGGFAIDEEKGLLVFGAWDKSMHSLDMRTGKPVAVFETYEPIYSTPIIHNGKVYMGLLDKRIVCLDPASGKLLWQHQTHSRVFATPVIIDGSLYCGSNDGRLYEIDPENGRERSFFQLSERIVNSIAYNPKTKRFFVPTFANELYCLSKTVRSAENK